MRVPKEAGCEHSDASRRCRGQSLVELALSLPIMLAVIMGVIDLSFVLYASIHVAAAAGEGARAGSLHSGDLNLTWDQNRTAREQVVRNAVYNPNTGTTSLGLMKHTSPNFNVGGTDVEVTYPNGHTLTTGVGDDMVVTVRYRQPLWFNLLPSALVGALQVSSSARIRIQ